MCSHKTVTVYLSYICVYIYKLRDTKSDDGYQTISVVRFYFHGIKAKKRGSVQAKLLIGPGKQKNTFGRSQ